MILTISETLSLRIWPVLVSSNSFRNGLRALQYDVVSTEITESLTFDNKYSYIIQSALLEVYESLLINSVTMKIQQLVETAS